MAGLTIKTRRSAYKAGFMEGKPTLYRQSRLIFPKVTDEQLIEEIARTMGITKAQAQAAFAAMVDRVCHYLELGHQVTIGKLGSFAPAMRAASFKTEEEMATTEGREKAIKQVYVRFTPHKALRELIANASVTENTQEIGGWVDDPTRQ